VHVTVDASFSAVCPKLLHILNPSDNIDAVIGLGIIDDIIYVVRSWTSNIELYGAVSLKPMKAIQVLTLDLPHDMVSCAHQKCLYLSDYGSDIHRIEVSGYRMQTKWSAGSRPTGLSITIGAANVMVTYEYSQKVMWNFLLTAFYKSWVCLQLCSVTLICHKALFSSYWLV